METIGVSGYVKRQLDELKEAEEHRSYDSAIRTLLSDYDGDLDE